MAESKIEPRQVLTKTVHLNSGSNSYADLSSYFSNNDVLLSAYAPYGRAMMVFKNSTGKWYVGDVDGLTFIVDATIAYIVGGGNFRNTLVSTFADRWVA